MAVFDLDVSERKLAGAANILRRNRLLLATCVRVMKEQRLTKADIARKLGVNRSTVSGMLRGNANLTFRTEGELLWALGIDPFEFEKTAALDGEPSTWV